MNSYIPFDMKNLQTKSFNHAKKVARDNRHRLAVWFTKRGVKIMRCLKHNCGASLLYVNGIYSGSALSHKCINQRTGKRFEEKELYAKTKKRN